MTMVPSLRPPFRPQEKRAVYETGDEELDHVHDGTAVASAG